MKRVSGIEGLSCCLEQWHILVEILQAEREAVVVVSLRESQPVLKDAVDSDVLGQRLEEVAKVKWWL